MKVDNAVIPKRGYKPSVANNFASRPSWDMSSHPGVGEIINWNRNFKNLSIKNLFRLTKLIIIDGISTKNAKFVDNFRTNKYYKITC